MSKKLLKFHVSECNEDRYMFYCPGCDEHHWISSSWTITGTEDNPTVRPSIRARKGGGINSVCHLFITDGKIHYLSDCTHSMKGCTVEMEEV